MFTPKSKALIALHFTIFLWGFTAILGKLISYGSFILVWHRMVITFLVYLLIPSVWIQFREISWRKFGIYFGIGLLVASHWLFFYGSIKLGDSASVTLACMGATSFFSSIIEPYMLSTPYSVKDIALGVVVIMGVLFIYYSLPHTNSSGGSYKYAIASGLCAALVGSTFTVLNKKYIAESSPLLISAIEMGAGALVLTIITPALYGHSTQWYPTIDIHDMSLSSVRSGSWDLIWVLILSVVCTNLTFYLSTSSLHHISAFTANLSVNLEPIYGIILGALIFHENNDLNIDFYIGTSIILFAIFINPILSLFEVTKSTVEDNAEKGINDNVIAFELVSSEGFGSKLDGGDSDKRESIFEQTVVSVITSKINDVQDLYSVYKNENIAVGIDNLNEKKNKNNVNQKYMSLAMDDVEPDI